MSYCCRFITSAALLVSSLCGTLPADESSEFTPLFNGKDLDGWVLVNTPPETWRVQDGMLICSGKPIGEIRTAKMYQNYILELEWRHMRPKGNAGVFVWADDITARGVPFHRSIEVQVLENAYGNSPSHTTHGDIFPIHGAVMTPVNGRGGSRAFPTEERSKASPEWNHYRVECRDGEISLAVNGKVVTRGKECSPRVGYICLESEGGIVHYRNIKIKVLPNSTVERKHVAVANRGFRSIYTGLSLKGLQASDQQQWRVRDWVLSYAGEPSDEKTQRLATDEEFTDFGFLLDVRGSKQAQALTIAPRGGTGTTLRFQGEQDSLDKPGRWSRIEGIVSGNTLTLTVNGRAIVDVVLTGSKKGPLVLVPNGAMEFANLFVRSLGEK
ncbi:MAG: family 16 glycoside hydrolase [Pirellulaceae bacterium]